MNYDWVREECASGTEPPVSAILDILPVITVDESIEGHSAMNAYLTGLILELVKVELNKPYRTRSGLTMLEWITKPNSTRFITRSTKPERTIFSAASNAITKVNIYLASILPSFGGVTELSVEHMLTVPLAWN